jgi:hypothetical protein
VCYNSLASKGKGFRHRIQSDDLASNWTIWQFREDQMGPTILLKSLLAQNHHSLHDFLDGVGVQNQGTTKGANSLGVWRKKSKEKVDCDHSVMSSIQTSEFCSQQSQLKSIYTVGLVKKRVRLCHLSNPWVREITNCA